MFKLFRHPSDAGPHRATVGVTRDEFEANRRFCAFITKFYYSNSASIENGNINDEGLAELRTSLLASAFPLQTDDELKSWIEAAAKVTSMREDKAYVIDYLESGFLRITPVTPDLRIETNMYFPKKIELLLLDREMPTRFIHTTCPNNRLGK